VSARHKLFTGAGAMRIVALEVAVIYFLSTLPTPLYVVYREIGLVPVIDFFSVYGLLGAGDTEVTGSEIHCPSKARCVSAYSDFSAASLDSSWASSALR
jgi:hypothetical protein